MVGIGLVTTYMYELMNAINMIKAEFYLPNLIKENFGSSEHENTLKSMGRGPCTFSLMFSLLLKEPSFTFYFQKWSTFCSW